MAHERRQAEAAAKLQQRWIYRQVSRRGSKVEATKTIQRYFRGADARRRLARGERRDSRGRWYAAVDGALATTPEKSKGLFTQLGALFGLDEPPSVRESRAQPQRVPEALALVGAARPAPAPAMAAPLARYPTHAKPADPLDRLAMRLGV